jgi:hypothetical protein
MRKPIAKKPKKITKRKQLSLARTAKRKSLADWSKKVRERDGGACIVCGSASTLNAHHVLPKENYHEFMYEVINGVTLCPTHHKFGKYSAHKNPIWFAKYLQEFRCEQYNWACKNVGFYE